jgi:heme exporter protein A
MVHPNSLQVTQLAFERNQQMLFSNLQFELHSGAIFQLRGANGSGKSTLLRLLAAFLEPVAGDIRWDKKSVLRQPRVYQENLHYLGHHNGLKANLTARENCQLYASIAAQKISGENTNTILAQLALTTLADKQVNALSAGQARRVALARLLLDPRSLWLLDEPATGLDASGVKFLSQILLHHVSHGGMAIIATHDDLELACDVQTLELGNYYV